ncbi:MAG: molybdopterin-synthase adenylyltransferase MoeB [Candidatus Eisenbacteria bacterium]
MSDTSLPDLTLAETRRYGRHLVLPEVGLEGQRRLKSASALIIGAGGLGSPIALYLAAAGVGRLGLVDFDVVDETNLQRQIAHGTSSIGQPKMTSMVKRLTDLNPHVRLEPHAVRLDRTNALRLLPGYDVILDGTDNFAARYLVNDACVMLGKPNCYGSILRFEGQASVFDARVGPCYRCLFPVPPEAGVVPSCAEAGVLGVLPGVIGAIQANEAIKLMLGVGEPLIGRLLLYDALEMRFRELKLRKDPDCPMCGMAPRIRELEDYESVCGVGVTSLEASVQHANLSVKELRELRATDPAIQLLDVREPQEWAINRIQGATHIPVGVLPERAKELDPARTLVVYCHHGGRSARAQKLLQQQGFTDVRNLTGGIDAWSREIDPTVPRY